MIIEVPLTVVINATPTTGTLLDSATYVIDAGQTLELVPADLVIDGVRSADLRLRSDRVHAPELTSVGPTTLLNVEVWLTPSDFEVMKPEESLKTDALRSESCGVLVLAAENPSEVDVPETGSFGVVVLDAERSFEGHAPRSEDCGVFVLAAENPFEVDKFGWEI